MSTERQRHLFLENIPYNLSIYRQETKSGHQGILHIHNVFELLLVLTDGASVCIDTDCYPIPRNTLLMFTHSDLHCIRKQEGSVYDRYVLYLCPEQVDVFSTEQTHLLECFYRRPNKTSQIMPLTDEQVQVILPLFSQLDEVQSHQQYMLGDDLLKRFLLCQILIYTNRYYRLYNGISNLQSGADSRVVYTALTYIAEHYTEPLSLSDLGHTVFLSPHYFCRLFKQVIGTSPMEYVGNLRMAKAKELLIQGTSVEKTCERVGYGNLSHFSRQFKQKMGVSPRQYIALNRAEK